MGKQLELPMTEVNETAVSDFDVEAATWIAELLLEGTTWDIETAKTIAKTHAAKVEKGASSAFEKARMTVALDRVMTLQGVVGGLQGFPELTFVKDIVRFRHVSGLVRASRR